MTSIPPRPLSGPRATRFIGRERELEALQQRMSASRLVTVLGPPGVGKSRLVVESTALTPGTAWVDLTEARDAEATTLAIGAVLGVPLVGATPADQLGHALASRGRSTLVLDNAEVAIDAVREVVQRLVSLAPELVVIVTSRVRLGLAEEALLDLGPLELPGGAANARASESVELFLTRVAAVREAFEPDPRELSMIAELVRQLDGLPLAIELAASRTRLLSLPELLEHLQGRAPGGRLHVLASAGTRGAVLHAEIARSVERLDGAHRSALAQVSVFRGGFTVGAAAPVVRLPDGAPPLVDVLESLADRSLVVIGTRGGVPRFSLLLSIRDFAAEELRASGEAREVSARHARTFADSGLAAADRLTEPSSALARREVARERDNLLAAFEWSLENASEAAHATDALALAVALGAGLLHLGPLAFCHAVLSRAWGSAAKARPLALAARVLAAKIEVEVNLERPSQSVEVARALLERALEEQDSDAEARVATALGEALTAEGAFDEGRLLLERALSVENAAGRRAREARVLHALGVNRVEAGALAEGRLAFRRALRLLEDGDRGQLARSLNTAGVLALEEGILDEAEGLLKRGLDVAREAGDLRAEATLIGNLAACRAETGDLDQAEVGYARAVDLHRAIGSRRNQALNVSFLGHCALERGSFATATERYEEALDLLQGLGWRRASILGPHAAALAMLGDRDRARATLTEARAELERIGHERLLSALDAYEGFLDLAAARVADARGDKASAQGHLAAAKHKIAATMTRGESPRGGPALAAQSTDVRVAVRALERALAADGHLAAAADAPATKLEIASDASWFVPSAGERVSLERRRALRLVLSKLVEARLETPGAAVGTAALVAAGWPGESPAPDVGADRLYTALSTLRKLGLKEIIQNRGDGYRIDPDLPVVRR